MRVPLFSLLLLLPAAAQDGEQLYTTYCSACHAPDGAGATGGAFPPLAGSAWVKGEPDRAAKIILHGLEGPVTVSGKTYDLAMPPQGAVLSDAQIAAVLTYVRSAWGNQEPAVSADQIKAIRTQFADRSAYWTSAELLKLHPLPLEQTALRDLISRVYHGSWEDIPDFEKLESQNVEEEHNGVISLSITPRKNDFGIVWEGKFAAPATGEYEFRLDADDGARVIVDGKKIAEVRGIGPIGGNRAKTGKIKLSEGLHPIRIEYFEAKGEEGITLAWRIDGKGQWHELSDQQSQAGGGRPIIPLAPVTGRPVIYRNFIANTSPRAIGVGFPGGVNLAWSADHLGPELIWTGAFMDAGRHWTNRGQGNEPPAGNNVVELSRGQTLPEGGTFRGYQLDTDGNPTFTTTWGDAKLTDTFSAGPGSEGNAATASLVRTLTYHGAAEPMEILISQSLEPEPLGDGHFGLGNQIFLHATAGEISARGKSAILTLRPNQSVTLTYRWSR
jgi:mono/diheme cytochrome c family protein